MRKMRVFTAVALAVMLLGGCGTTANNLGGAADGYNDAVYGNNNSYNTRGGLAYWDGYGVNDGRPVTTQGSTDRTEYGMRKGGWEIGNEVNRAADEISNGRAAANGGTTTNSMVN